MSEQEFVRLNEDQVRQRRSRSIAIAVILLGMVALFYGVTLVRLGGNIANRAF